MITYTLDEFKKHWLNTNTNGEDKGIAMFLETTPAFFAYKMQKEENKKEKRSFRFLLYNPQNEMFSHFGTKR